MSESLTKAGGIGTCSRSWLKTWLKRHRFKPTGWGATNRMGPERNSWSHGGRLYRFRKIARRQWVVDVGEMRETFDRWANSTERSGVPLVLWLLEFPS